MPAVRNVQFNPSTGKFSYVDSSGHTVFFPPGPLTQPGAAPPVNTYPLQMQPVKNPGDPVMLGVGPDTLVFVLSNNPMSIAAGAPLNSAAIILGTLALTGPLTVSANTGASGGQVFTIRGDFGPGPHQITVASGNQGSGLRDMWQNAASMNLVPLYYNGKSLDARGGAPVVNATQVWDNIGEAYTISETRVPVTPPATPSLIDGATIDGKPVSAATLADLAKATPHGSALVLPAGHFLGTAAVGGITMDGQPGATTIDCTGLAPTYGKGILVPTESGFIGRHLVLTGAAVADNNGAAVRQAGDGIDYTLEDCEIFGNQDGLLNFSGNVMLTRCHIHDNGASDGFSHEVYVSGDTPGAGVLTMTDDVVACGTKSTHALKSRFGKTVVSGGSFLGNADDGTVGGSVLDFPNGGLVAISGAKITMGKGAGNHQLISFALENTNNASIGMTLTLDGVAIDSQGAGGIIQGVPGATLKIVNSTYTGTVAPQLPGWGTIDGGFTPAD